MVRFRLELAADADVDADDFARGHVTIHGSEGTASSRGSDPDQSMWLFPSAVELLDGVRRFLDDGTTRYEFVGVDSSFQFVLERETGERIRVVHGGELIETVDETELVRAVWNAVSSLDARYRRQLDQHGAVVADLRAAIEEFDRAFGLRERTD
jgi:hypothetical protein